MSLCRTYRRNGRDEHDRAGGGALARVVGGQAGHDSADDAADVEQDGEVGSVLGIDIEAWIVVCLLRSKS